MNPRDLVSLKRIINVPSRGIGKVALLKFLSEYLGTEVPRHARAPRKSHEALTAFDRLMQDLRGRIKEERASSFVRHLLKTIRYREYLNDASEKSEERWENIEELVSLAKNYDEPDPPAGLEKLLEDVALMSEEDISEGKQEGVTMMTIHAAKGLEFRAVFIVGLEEGMFPHARALTDIGGELEEERRLCYVALTRAKEKVFLSLAATRTRFGSTQANPPSRFLGEIPECLLEVDEEPTIHL